MSFKKSSSKVERECPLGEVARKAWKGFGITCQSFIRVRKRIQYPPQKRHQNVIAQVVGWENPEPTTKWRQLREHLPTVTLGRYSHHFRDEVITSMGESR
jgi:hypothetical protein